MLRDLTTGDVAKVCGVAPRTVAKWCNSGVLPNYRLPLSRDRRIRPADLVEFANKYGLPTRGITAKPLVLLVGTGLKKYAEAIPPTFEAAFYATAFQAGTASSKARPTLIGFGPGVSAQEVTVMLAHYEASGQGRPVFAVLPGGPDLPFEHWSAASPEDFASLLDKPALTHAG